jgi:uncharacterized repeat protein (TIGR02543 family)
MVSLVARPASGWTFAGWSGACTGSGTCGVTLSSDQTVTARFTPSPAVSRLRVSPTKFSAAARGPSASAAGPGAHVSFTLSSAATVRLTVERCVALSKRKHAAQKCHTLPGGFAWPGKAGSNGFHFSGRLNGRRLSPGSYMLTAAPTGTRGRPATVSSPFQIIA